jgi:excisionase family DNA binding protein
MTEGTASADPFQGRLALTVPEALKALSISRSGFYEAVARGEITITKIGRKTLVPLAPLMARLGGEVRS